MSTVLPTLTETELRRLLVLADHALERSGHYRASTLAEEALPSVEVVALALDSIDELLAASAALYVLRRIAADNCVETVRTAEDALDAVLERLLDLDATPSARWSLPCALRATRPLAPPNASGANPGGATPLVDPV